MCITILYNFAEKCGYGDMREEMIHDRLIVGIRDTSLSEGIQLDADLTSRRQRKLLGKKKQLMNCNVHPSHRKKQPNSA